MPNLTSLDNVKDWLQIDSVDTSQDNLLTRLITACSANFLGQINRPGFMPDREYFELVSLADWQGDDIFLRNYPVNTVIGVTVDELAVLAYDPTKPELGGWIFDDELDDEARQKISLRGFMAGWPSFGLRHSIYRPSPLRINVHYMAGYDEVPPDVEQAIIEWVAFLRGFRELQSTDQTTQWIQLGSYQQNTSIATSTQKASAIVAPESVMAVIQGYTRPIIS